MMSHDVPHDQSKKWWEWQEDEGVIDMSVGGAGNEEIEEVAGALVDPLRSTGETPVQDRKESVPDVS